MCATGTVFAQSQSAPTPPDPPPAEKETWKAPFGGTFTASLSVTSDYSYRGISQTQRNAAIQPGIGYETPQASPNLPLSAYIGAWGSNVNFPGTGANPEIDLLGGFRLKTLEDKLSFDLGYIRYNYLGAPDTLQLGFNEFGLVAGYDFGVVQLSGALRYSPNFFANSGVAWYKWGQLTVPLTFLPTGENLSFKIFGTVGNQYVERFTNYGIPSNNYWDWQIGVTATFYGFDLTLAYVDTNIDYAGCLNTLNCEARAIFTLTKSF